MMLPKHVKIVEVGPRDGLQAEEKILFVETRIHFINLLSESGLKAIEVGSFVSLRWIPQLAMSDKVYQGIIALTILFLFLIQKDMKLP